MKLPRGVKRGDFMMAKHEHSGLCYQLTDAYRLGALAIHHADGCIRWWRISHARTGRYIPYSMRRTLLEAFQLARKLDKAIDWQAVRRAKSFNRPPVGMTLSRTTKIKKVLGIGEATPA